MADRLAIMKQNTRWINTEIPKPLQLQATTSRMLKAYQLRGIKD